MSLPAADELFRSTGGAPVQPSTPHQHTGGGTTAAPRVPAPDEESAPAGDGGGPDHTAGAAVPPSSAEQEGHGGRGGQGTVPGQQGTGRSARGGQGTTAQPAAGGPRGQARARVTAPAPHRRGRVTPRRPSGRERHDEKITVYVSAEELMDLEHARLVLRGEHGLAVDRGRIVREAVAVVLADLEARGDASILVRRLRGR
ncbi:MAG TPA: hypothetical protein VFY14_02290 [Streptomyces sp.]|nr:hypothetical protein [Streptomyces sp.]